MHATPTSPTSAKPAANYLRPGQAADAELSVTGQIGPLLISQNLVKHQQRPDAGRVVGLDGGRLGRGAGRTWRRRAAGQKPASFSASEQSMFTASKATVIGAPVK
jgi:hypothetical protein